MFTGFFVFRPSQKTPSILKPKGTHSVILAFAKFESPNCAKTLTSIEVQKLNLRLKGT